MFSYFEHPNDVCMSYLEHAKFSFTIGLSLFGGSCKAFVHALVPSFFIKSSSVLVQDLSERLLDAGCKD